MTTFQSDVSNEIFPISEKVSAKTIRPSIFNLIQKENPQFTRESSLSKSELKKENHIQLYSQREWRTTYRSRKDRFGFFG